MEPHLNIDLDSSGPRYSAIFLQSAEVPPRKAIQNQRLTSSVLNPSNREVWRQMG